MRRGDPIGWRLQVAGALYGPWSPGRPSGEPTKHPIVQQMLKGYERVAFEDEGYSAAGAVPIEIPGAYGAPGRTRS